LKLAAALFIGLVATAAPADDDAWFEFDELPPLPDTIGLAGPFVGVSNGAIIVAGGANFPEGFPGSKIYHDDIRVLHDGAWSLSPVKLDRPLGYGVSISTADGIVCIGGLQSDGVFELRWDEPTSTVVIRNLPPLPEPVSSMGGALVGETIYIVGGDAGSGATDSVWALDLSDPAWRPITPIPGAPRILPVVVAQNDGRTDCLFVISGRNAGPDRETEILTDAYAYCPSTGEWRTLTPPPRCVMAAPGIAHGANHVLVFGGADGDRLKQIEAASGDERTRLLTDHPGFSRDVLAYHTITDAWTSVGTMPPGAPVTTTAIRFGDRIVIPPGEIRPGVRTPVVLAAQTAGDDAGFGTLNWTVLALYMVCLVAIGIRCARREQTTADYFLAGRRVVWWAAGLSIFATQLSAITYLGIPARAFATDWVYATMAIGILLVAPIVVYLYLPLYRGQKITSVYEYLESRFGLGTRLLGSVSFVAFQLARMGVVILLPALALSAVTGLDVYMCIAIMGILSTVYTVLGGIEAVIWTDVIQVFVLVAGAVAALVLVARDLGGLGVVLDTATAANKLDLVSLDLGWAADGVLVIAVATIFGNLVPYTADQAVIQRYLTTPDERQARRAIWTNGLMSIPAVALFFLVGTALFAYFAMRPADLGPIERVDQVFPWFIAHRMPAGLAGLVIAGVFAAAMSSLDSSMHSVATAVTTDFVRRLGPPLDEKRYLTIARWLTVALGVLGTGTAMLMAGSDIKFLWDFFMGIVGLLLGTLGGLFALGVLTKRPVAAHAWVGVIVSVATLIYVKYYTDINGLAYAGIGVTTCLVAGWLASLTTPDWSKA
jgi:SSS family transporter